VTRARILLAAGALLVLGAVNYGIVSKELVKRRGEVVYLELGPRDPRSLMQGDYMALRFPIAAQIAATWAGAPPREGEMLTANLLVDERRVATLAPSGASSTIPVRYRVRNRQVWLGTNAFFFEEGTDRRYAPARYGEFRVDRSTGEAVLVGLRDAKLGAL
jgi:uncharacterized membrane-anchored protein